MKEECYPICQFSWSLLPNHETSPDDKLSSFVIKE
jgi:hypothetical protein